jgi:hypothetical protein
MIALSHVITGGPGIFNCYMNCQILSLIIQLAA